MFDVADAPFDFPFGAGTTGAAGLWCQSPIPTESLEAWIEDHLAGLAIMGRDQRRGVIAEHLLGEAAELSECSIETLEPVVLPLGKERPAVEPTRVPQDRGHQVDFDGLPGDTHDLLAEVDLGLLPRRRLEPDRGQGLGPLLLAEGTNSSLQCSQLDVNPATGQFLLNDDRIPLGDGAEEIMDLTKRGGPSRRAAGRS